MRSWLLIPLFCALGSSALATVDYLAVNHLTREYYWGDEDRGIGLIGWSTVPASAFPYQKIAQLRKQGYSETRFPYKLDLLLGLLAWGVGVALLRSYLRKRRMAATAQKIDLLGKKRKP